MGYFSDEQREQILYHCGYTAAIVQGSLSFGQPLPVETMFLIQRTVENWDNPVAVPRVIRTVEILDKIECLMVDALDRLSSTQVGNVTLRADEEDQLEIQYAKWASKLAEILGVPLYAYATKFKKVTGVVAGNIPTRH